jgi:hypothetical protein
MSNMRDQNMNDMKLWYPWNPRKRTRKQLIGDLKLAECDGVQVASVKWQLFMNVTKVHPRWIQKIRAQNEFRCTKTILKEQKRSCL